MPTQFGDIVKDKIASGGYRTSFAVSLINGMMVSGCETILTQNNTLAQLRKSDLIIGISSLFCGSLVAEYLNKPYVIIYPAIFAGFYSFAMIPSPPSYVPVIQSDLTDRMTFVERVKNVVLFGIKELMLYFIIFPEYKRFQEKFSIHPDKNLGEIIGMAEIHIVLSDFSNEFTHPLMPSEYILTPGSISIY